MAQKTTRRLALIMSAAFAVTLGGTASGTPSSGISSTVHLARATIEESVNVNSDGIRFKTKQPTDISVVTLSMAPGATTGWHRHPGIVMTAVTREQERSTVPTADRRPTPLATSSSRREQTRRPS